MYPSIEPYETGFLDVGEGHRLYYEVSGNPDGRTAVFLHGGPGGGSHAEMRRLFHPEDYRIILFDQRGAGKSTPAACTAHNSIEALVEDMERLRGHLRVDQWLVAGGSWGSTLALFYSLRYPESVRALVLTGIFLAGAQEARWLAEEGGASEMMPEWFAPYRDFIPPAHRKNGLAAAYDTILRTGTEEEILEAVRLFTVWDTALLYFDVPQDRIEEVNSNPRLFVPLVKIYFHFMIHYFRDQNRTDILEGVKKLGHIPCFIVQGRHDLICPARQAYDLHKAFPNSELHMLHGTGHTTREPDISRKVVEITNQIVGRTD